MDCSDCKELYKERNQKAPCDCCNIAKMEAEQETVQAEYLNREEQAQAEARQQAEAQQEEEYYAEMEWEHGF